MISVPLSERQLERSAAAVRKIAGRYVPDQAFFALRQRDRIQIADRRIRDHCRHSVGIIAEHRGADDHDPRVILFTDKPDIDHRTLDIIQLHSDFTHYSRRLC